MKVGSAFLQVKRACTNHDSGRPALHSKYYPAVRGTLTSHVDMLRSHSDKLPGYENCHVAVII